VVSRRLFQYLKFRVSLALCVSQSLTHRNEVAPEAKQPFTDVTANRRARYLSQLPRESIEIHHPSTEQSTGFPGIALDCRIQRACKFGDAMPHAGSDAQRRSCSLQRSNR
jgi:hypothetical protein